MGEIALSKVDDGKTVTASVGDVIVVNLPEVPTTGFRWKPVTPDQSMLELQSDSFISGSDAGIGGGGTRIFRYEVLRSGSASMEFQLERPWEPTHIESVTYQILAR